MRRWGRQTMKVDTGYPVHTHKKFAKAFVWQTAETKSLHVTEGC